MREDNGRKSVRIESDEFNMTPLMRAAWLGNVDSVKALLTEGADPNARPHGASPALYLAMETYCSEEMVHALLTAGADVNLLGQGEHTILHRAVTNAEVNVIRMLIEAGAEVNVQEDEGGSQQAANYDGITPLMIAALRDDGPDIIPILLAAGADITLRDRKGRTALTRAKERGIGESIELLVAAGAKD